MASNYFLFGNITPAADVWLQRILMIELPDFQDIGCIGFSGTDRGMNENQSKLLFEFLSYCFERGFRTFRHGDCIGSDDQAAGIAKSIGFYVIAHPGFRATKPDDTSMRAFSKHNHQVLPIKECLKRNQDIVNMSKFLLATPRQSYNVTRSGTWTTVRYATKHKKNVYLAFPNQDRISIHHV